MSHQLKRPSRLNTAREMLAGLDTLGAPGAMIRAWFRPSDYQGQYPVMVMPGYGANDLSTAALRYYLTKNGFDTMGWGAGFNLGGRGLAESTDDLSDRWNVDRARKASGEQEVPALCDLMTDHVKNYCDTQKTKIHLVGWSLGGYVAREVARDLPDQVASVTTLGSPVRGGPKYTSLAPLFKARNMDLDWIEAEIDKRAQERPITQPVTVIFSKRDGVVGWEAMQDSTSENVRHVEVDSSHMGIGMKSQVWDIVVDALVHAEKPLAGH